MLYCKRDKWRIVLHVSKPPDADEGQACRTSKGTGITPRLLHAAQLEIQIGGLAFVVVLRADLLDLRLGQIQLSLAQFDDRAQTQAVSSFRKIECLCGLVKKLLRE